MRAVWVGYLAVGALITAIYLAMPAGPGAFVYEGLGLSAVAAIVVGVRLHGPRHAAPWYLIATGLGLFTLGDSIYNANAHVFDTAPFPSVADVAYLGGYPVLCAGLVQLVRRRLPGDGGSLIEALILGVASGVASWVVLMQPYADDRGLRLIEQVASIAYPAADVVLLVVLARVLLAPGRRPLAFTVLFAGIAASLAADTGFAWRTLYSTYLAPDPNDVLYALSYLLIGAAALHPSMVDLEQRQVARRSRPIWHLVVVGFAAVTPAAFLLRNDEDHIGVIVAGAVLVPLLALARVVMLTREAERQVSVDPLTRLPNRSVLFARVSEALDRARGAGTYVAVLYLDLDRFKFVNDTYGQVVGDELLVGVAERLRHAIRHGDAVARVGGDEFVVVCEGLTGQETALSAADRLALALAEPFPTGVTSFSITASVGIAIGSGTEDPDTLLNDADAAMYRAKERGRGRAELFERSMRQQTSAGTTRLDEDLHFAIEREELRLYFQPQIDLESGALIGVEALLRWQHPEWGTLPPATIVPIAEETGLIVPIGEWVLDEACRYAQLWNIEMTVNLSVRQLVDPGIVTRVSDALARWDVPADRLIIDVTGSSDASRDERAVANLLQLRDLGVHVAIDDFGPDGVTIGALRNLHADRLKLDRSMVLTVTESEADRVIIGALCALGRDLGMKIVAEGVETRSQRAALADLGCHDGLGHLWAPPLPPGSVLDQVLGRTQTA
ncbi:MAG TPA: bifunctional diguanylate cyclase/phosphodiesterase [Acidimicrobiales bacterium]|nr:bifunctional diguanylate cyclase/phosphodiesterase [Acidimicrobiales bacterium]